MNRKTLLALALITAVVAGAADAQDKGKKKLYRWVDADGKVHFSDALPPEAVDQARKEFSATSGMSTGAIDRALTAEERAALAAQAASAAEQAKIEEERKRQEQAMLASYETEDDLKRAFDTRVELLKQAIEAVEASIGGQRDSLLAQLADAAATELAGRPVDAKRAQTIRDLRDELVRHQDLLIRREVEMGALDLEYKRTLERYRELGDGSEEAAAAGG
ncbi:MAG TPA: DUF4124 domain-containing protein [Arenimonas sp.]|nr:DUF4124 domain-containing protein [Arenimonas sp.]